MDDHGARGGSLRRCAARRGGCRELFVHDPPVVRRDPLPRGGTPPEEVADDVAVLRGDDPQLEDADELSAFQLREAAFERVVDDVEQRCGFTLDEL